MSKLRLAAKLGLSLAACLVVQGCVGLFVSRTETKTFRPAGVENEPTVHAVGGPSWGTNNPTTTWLEDHWGKPASIRPVLEQPPGELWTYKFGHVWCGVIPALVVPVPLVLHLAREKVVFFVQEGRVVSADAVAHRFTGTGAMLLGPDGSPVAGSSW